MKSCLKITVIVVLTILPISALGASNKHALIIGNSAYKEVPLKNPVNDANDMASTLEQLGFTVLKKTNVDQQTIEQAFREFEQQLQSNDIALFYFSGHGLQIDGINYLLPIGADIYSADEIKYKAVNANMILDKLQNVGTQLNIIILDACRNNSIKQFRSLERGLAIMSASTGAIISYATAPGSVAYDGDERNSPYTKYLLKTMVIPGLEVEKVFKQVRVAVMAETSNRQVPWESSSLTGDFYFISPPSVEPQSEEQEYSRWMSREEYQLEFERQAKQQFYPKRLEGREDGGRIEFRALFVKYPSRNFGFYTHHGLSTSEYDRKDKEYTAKGFRRICHQEFVTSSGQVLHQATWITPQ